MHKIIQRVQWVTRKGLRAVTWTEKKVVVVVAIVTMTNVGS